MYLFHAMKVSPVYRKITATTFLLGIRILKINQLNFTNL